MACITCSMRQELHILEEQHRREHIAMESVLLLEETDATIVSIYKPLTKSQRDRLLHLLSEIDKT